MAFVGNNGLKAILDSSDIISHYNSERIKNGAYELSLGAQVFQTDSSPRSVKNLSEGEKIEIKPGQFALLLTKEYVKIPENKIAFISIKAGVKFKGLVNVSGFHVDPGFEGNLLFSVYNAGPANIILSNGKNYFPMWFADLGERQDYEGSHEKQIRIPDDPVEALSQGELASPNVLSQRIDEVRHAKTKIEWVFLALLTLAIGASVKLWLDNNKLKEAVEFGYEKKNEELRLDSMQKVIQNQLLNFNTKLDSVAESVKKEKLKR